MSYGVLGSASSARAKILNSLGLKFQIFPTYLEEEEVSDEGDIFLRALKIAEAKMQVLRKNSFSEASYFICADTCVLFEGKCLGKPNSRKEAKEWLMSYSGKVVQVCTGLVLFSQIPKKKLSCQLVNTTLKFAKYTSQAVDFYLSLGPPWQVAGGFAWQEGAELLVKEIKGSSSNIIGLPIFEFYVMLKEHGLV